MWGMGVFCPSRVLMIHSQLLFMTIAWTPSLSAMCCILKKFLGWEVAPHMTVLRWELLCHRVDSPVKRAMLF